MLTTSNFFESVGPFVKKFWGLGQKSQLDKAQFSAIFDVAKHEDPYMDVVEHGGTTTLKLKTEGEPIQQDRMAQGVKKRFVAATYAGGLQLSYELVKDTKYDQIKRSAAKLGRSTQKTPEYLTALYLDRSCNSSFPALGDGKELCSTSHTTPRGGTYANLLSTPAPFNEAGIEQIMTNLRTQKGTDDLLDPLMAESLLVPSSLFIKAEKLSLTKKQVGSANNDVSRVAGLKVVPFDFLTNLTRWYVLTDRNEGDDGLFWKWVEKPSFIQENINDNLSVKYMAFFRAFFGCIDGRSIYCSNAT